METTQVALNEGVNEHVVGGPFSGLVSSSPRCNELWIQEEKKKAASTSHCLTKENIFYILLL